MIIQANESICLQENEISMEFVRASGPGGQNVNKVATAVKLYFDIDRSPSLPEEVKRRLRSLAGKRVSQEDVLVIDARRFRTQEANRRDALERLLAMDPPSGRQAQAAPSHPPRRRGQGPPAGRKEKTRGRQAGAPKNFAGPGIDRPRPDCRLERN